MSLVKEGLKQCCMGPRSSASRIGLTEYSIYTRMYVGPSVAKDKSYVCVGPMERPSYVMHGRCILFILTDVL